MECLGLLLELLMALVGHEIGVRFYSTEIPPCDCFLAF